MDGYERATIVIWEIVIWEVKVKYGSFAGLLVLVWLIIGALAAGQRGYFGGSDTTCAKAGTIAVTIVAGPLNYVGANPKIKCNLPEPSK